MGAQKHVLLCFPSIILLTGVMLASPLFLCAQNGDPSAAFSNSSNEHESWWKNVTYDGLVSLSYTYKANDPVLP
jgi:hypothetical protein